MSYSFYFDNSRRQFYFFSLLLLIILNYSCKTENRQLASTHKFVLKEIIDINLDSLTSIDATPIEPVVYNDSLCLLIPNKLNNSIDFYSGVKGGKLINRRKFFREGPQSINQIRTSVFKSKDSIYVIGKFHIIDAKLINMNGEMIDESPIELDWANNDYSVINHMSTVLLDDDKLFLSIGPLFDFGIPNNYKNFHSFEYRYDLTKNRIEKLPVFMPLEYSTGKKVQNFYSMIPERTLNNKRQLVYSWPNEAELAIYDIENIDKDSIFYKYAHNVDFGKLMKGRRGKINHREELEEALNHVLYTQILYDDYRNVYYRIAAIPSGSYAVEDLNHWTAFGRNQLGIIAMNEKFEIIASTILAKEEYDCYGAFVGPKGLYLSKNNIFRQDYDENKLVFSIFDLRSL